MKTSGFSEHILPSLPDAHALRFVCMQSRSRLMPVSCFAGQHQDHGRQQGYYHDLPRLSVRGLSACRSDAALHLLRRLAYRNAR